jgi:hypothetical protein
MSMARKGKILARNDQWLVVRDDNGTVLEEKTFTHRQIPIPLKEPIIAAWLTGDRLFIATKQLVVVYRWSWNARGTLTEEKRVALRHKPSAIAVFLERYLIIGTGDGDVHAYDFDGAHKQVWVDTLDEPVRAIQPIEGITYFLVEGDHSHQTVRFE